MAKNAAQQRIKFNFAMLDRLTGDHLLGDMAINRSEEARRSRKLLTNTVAEFLQSHFEDAGEYQEVKVFPASNGDESAVVILFEGPRLTDYQIDELVLGMTYDALAYLEDHDDDREDNPKYAGGGRTPNLAGQGSAWVMAEIDPFVLRQAVGVRNASQADCEAVARKLTEQFFDRDANWTMIAQAYNAIQDEREDNPRPGLSLGSVALGAAVGAAAMHVVKKRQE